MSGKKIELQSSSMRYSLSYKDTILENTFDLLALKFFKVAKMTLEVYRLCLTLIREFRRLQTISIQESMGTETSIQNKNERPS